MALQTINVKATGFGAFTHNNVVPGVEKISLFLAGDEHNPTAAVDLNGVFTEGATPDLNKFVVSDTNLPSGKVTIKGEREKSKMTYSLTQEKGLALYSISIEMYIPHMSATIHKEIEEFRGKALMAIVTMHDKFEVQTPNETDPTADNESAAFDASTIAGQYLVGWDNVLGFTSSTTSDNYSDFNLFLDSLEYDSGAGLEEKNGCTVKFTAVQGTAPIRRLTA
ncbi:hypothetical protein [uncultured Mediterranean phage uvMED]|nr:hypothetical protein [uncultured Mediterranean phage uvMED]